MIGLSRMAMKLAWFRTFKDLRNFDEWKTPIPRAQAGDFFPVAREYYAICDRMGRGEKP